MNELPSETGLNAQSPLQQHRGLVILVVTMGLLLVVGLAVIAVTIIYRISNGDSQQISNDDSQQISNGDSQQNDVSAVPAMVGETYDAPDPALAARHAPEISIARPAGAELIGATSAGDRLTLHFRGAGGDRVVVVDLVSGRVLSRVEIPGDNAATE